MFRYCSQVLARLLTRDIQKYDFGWSWFGIPTFFHLPVALTPEDLKAGNVEVAILGAYTDMGGGMRGAARGPRAFRNSEVYGGWGIVNLPNMHVLIDPLKELPYTGCHFP